MPNLGYQYHAVGGLGWPGPAPAGMCGGGADTNPITLAVNPVVVPAGQIVAAILVQCVFPPPVAAMIAELNWRYAAYRAGAASGPVNVTTTPVIQNVDPTEKGQLSYAVATMCTAWSATFQAGANLFMPVSRVNAALPALLNFVGPLRPDYFSMTPTPQWQVWESKGRVGGAVPGRLRNAYRQTQALASLNLGGLAPVPPDSRVACLARPGAPGGAGIWSLHTTDPVVLSGQAPDPSTLDALLREFYRPYKDLLASVSSSVTADYAGATFLTATLPASDITLGLDQRIVKALQATDPQSAAPGTLSSTILAVVRGGYSKQTDPKQAVTPGGVYAAAGSSW